MSRRRHDPEGPSLEALAVPASAIVPAYLGAEAALPGAFHPLHWLITAAGGGLGYFIGTGVFRFKEHREIYGAFFGRPRKRDDDHARRPRRRAK